MSGSNLVTQTINKITQTITRIKINNYRLVNIFMGVILVAVGTWVAAQSIDGFIASGVALVAYIFWKMHTRIARNVGEWRTLKFERWIIFAIALELLLYELAVYGYLSR